jgi:membrane protease YdiL (CAAX protease family)
LLAFILLTLAIVLLWLPARRHSLYVEYAWLGVFALALGVALYIGQLEWEVLLPLMLFGFACFAYSHLSGIWRLPLGLTLVGLSVGLGLHVFPGFHQLLIVDQVQLAPDSLAYSLRFNLDKPVIGLFILAWLHPLLRHRADVLSMLWQLFPIALLTLSAVVMASWLLGYIHFDVKLPDCLLYWLWANLFFTCVAEEALFRGFLQRQLAICFSKLRHGAIVALVVCAVLFGMAHAAGGMTYVLLATLAGLGYGWAYQRTQRIEASILLHFVLNSMHIIFFSYPALI